MGIFKKVVISSTLVSWNLKSVLLFGNLTVKNNKAIVGKHCQNNL